MKTLIFFQSLKTSCLLLSATLTDSFKNIRESGYLLGRQSHQRESCLTALFSANVFDNVVDISVCNTVDNQVKLGGLGHTVFLREFPPRTSVESVIHSILSSVNDSSPIVEYWWREEWMNLEMHRDLDEKLALEQGPIRFPSHAHVLYLSVGEEVFGPTIVLHDSVESTIRSFDKITVVPALTGRLLRFNGDMMHAVPRPPLAYFDPSVGGTNSELWTRRRPIDENDPELSVFRRSVLLFNTWTQNPPHEISLLPPPGTLDAHMKLQEEKLGQIDECHPQKEWNEVQSLPTVSACDRSIDEKSSVRLKIGLLGDIRRRERTDRYINVYAAAAIKDSFIGLGREQGTYALSNTSS